MTPNKPTEYAIKVFALVDSRTFYISHLEIYTDSSMRISKSILGSGRDLTSITQNNYNWYTQRNKKYISGTLKYQATLLKKCFPVSSLHYYYPINSETGVESKPEIITFHSKKWPHHKKVAEKFQINFNNRRT